MIRTATASDEAAVISALVLAFSTDPAVRWTWPDPQQYLQNFPPFIKAFGGRAFAAGSAYVAPDFAGAALWLPPGADIDDEGVTDIVESTVSKRAENDVFPLLEAMGRHHPQEPHWYLPLIGVDPSRQNQGHGEALMKHALAACDRDGHPAYLESTNPRNVPLYERHGFRVLARLQVGSSPPIFPMLREPRIHGMPAA
ncbi:GNAT family N-acetyltransferase [Aquabacterium sp.]|uniref:GNAT family N-acetyltransferase n=1 Tax=Aquabacterium sp. TaxID=1872578 RepID=UPI00248A5E7B|nr:GNAT family N-acetyltransferase [Aquabacterium sp.]MDI1260140.1 GNAT family N-acetyltransferase [Aquabacterium sp.]